MEQIAEDKQRDKGAVLGLDSRDFRVQLGKAAADRAYEQYLVRHPCSGQRSAER